jgi:ABC-type spermidine/putrescine transport system permease subunit II
MFTFLVSTSYLTISLAHWLVLISVFISLTGAFAYIRDMFRGKSKPNLITWGLWAFAPLIATGAALSVNADGWSTVRIFISGFSPLLVFVAAFIVRQGYWKLSKFDYACGGLSLLALGA